jgi:hypothetical protein
MGATAGAADPVDPFTLPPGYANARTATDPAKPLPATKAGELRSYATLHSLGFEWDIEGDTNHNATCRASYRRADESDWHEALSLFRVDYEGWYDNRKADRPYNMLAGSILFLRPGAEYLVRLSLDDSDGGKTERELTLRTRPVPDFGEPARTFVVMPRGANDKSPPGDGSRERPFLGIEEAQKIAKPGDRFFLLPGNYGEAKLDRPGEPAGDSVGAQPKYIVWQAAIGNAVFERLDLDCSHVWIEGLQFATHRPKQTALKAIGRAENLVVRANIFQGYNYSILLSSQSRGWYIADNEILGDDATGIEGEGIELNKSPDHTVCYNRVSRTADGVSYALRNCDIFSNEVFDISDDAVEPDYGYANTRIWGNRLAGPVGVSFQPMYCGPWYIVRNQILATTNAFKIRVQDRYLVANNTFVTGKRTGAALVHAHGLLSATTRNNLWIHAGTAPFVWSTYAPLDEKNREYMRKYVLYDVLTANWKSDVDYDGFDWSEADRHPRDPGPMPFIWNGARLDGLAALADKVGIEKHGKMVDKSRTFERYETPSAELPPSALILRSDGEAIDAGAPLANVIEEFSGQAPDLGAFEAGHPAPHVGPRLENWRERHDDWVLKHQRR